MSSAALRGNKQESVYCATKWAERGYTESLKACYTGTKVQIYGVYPDIHAPKPALCPARFQKPSAAADCNRNAVPPNQNDCPAVIP